MATDTLDQATGELVEVVPVEPAGMLEAQTRGEIDIQIRTARSYPRSIRQFIDTSRQMATLDEATAESCFYALPRGGKTIEGPSARLAEIVASAWGHMRVEGRIVAQDAQFVTARGVAWDLQANVAYAVEVKRRITDRSGRTYNDDMIVVTSNAAISVALRNAVFKVIPHCYTQALYEECRRVAVGDASTLVARRDKVLKGLLQMGATQERVLAAIGCKGVEDITLDHLATLKGAGSGIRDGTLTVDGAFPPVTVPDSARGVSAVKGRLGAGAQESAPAPAAPVAASAVVPVAPAAAQTTLDTSPFAGE